MDFIWAASIVCVGTLLIIASLQYIYCAYRIRQYEKGSQCMSLCAPSDGGNASSSVGMYAWRVDKSLLTRLNSTSFYGSFLAKFEPEQSFYSVLSNDGTTRTIKYFDSPPHFIPVIKSTGTSALQHALLNNKVQYVSWSKSAFKIKDAVRYQGMFEDYIKGFASQDLADRLDNVIIFALVRIPTFQDLTDADPTLEAMQSQSHTLIAPLGTSEAPFVASDRIFDNPMHVLAYGVQK